MPEDSVWIGGPDGGAYFRCHLATALTCTIYNDQTGDVWKQGIVALEDWQRLKYHSIEKFYADLNAFDGENIHLVDRSSSPLE